LAQVPVGQKRLYDITFQPGALGARVIPDTGSTPGKVTTVDVGGQADQLGVRVGSIIKQINGSAFAFVSLKNAIAGREPYTVTFQEDCSQSDKPKMRVTAKERRPGDDSSTIAALPTASSLDLEPVAKTTWEKLEETVDGLKNTLLSCRELVVDVESKEGADGWTVTVFVDAENLASSRATLSETAKQTLTGAVAAAEGVYLLGFQAQPFTPIPFGFAAKLAIMSDPEHACWFTFATGCCRNPGCCKRQHPESQAALNILFRPERKPSPSPAPMQPLPGMGINFASNQAKKAKRKERKKEASVKQNVFLL